MWASFTRDEKYLFLGLLAFLGIGAAVRPWWDAKRQPEVFAASAVPARVASQTSGTLTAPKGEAVAPQEGPIAAGIDESGRIDLNSATAETLEGLPGIGPSRAEAILRLRQQRGSFRSVEELDEVAGIGPATLAKLRPLVTVRQAAGQPAPPAGASSQAVSPGSGGGAFAPQPTPAQALAAGPAPTPLASATPVATAFVPSAAQLPQNSIVNINTASIEQLATLKYVGPKLAERIVMHRQQFGAFRSPHDLANVKGIGTRVLKENAGRITVR